LHADGASRKRSFVAARRLVFALALASFVLSFVHRTAPAAIAGALTGRVLIRHINQQAFELMALALTLIAGARLLM
jgi:hypothetical protein